LIAVVDLRPRPKLELKLARGRRPMLKAWGCVLGRMRGDARRWLPMTIASDCKCQQSQGSKSVDGKALHGDL